MSSSANAALEQLLQHHDLGQAEAAALMQTLASASIPPALAGALLVALRSKGETADEVRGFASAMRSLAHRVELPQGLEAVDVVGTGGDASGSLNLSTGTSLLAAACGVPVVKHGNRSVSSRSGSADVLEALGVPLAAEPDTALECLERCGFSFLFAPHFHPAMKALAPVRRALGTRTVFNILGPLTNPAAPPFGLIGAFDEATAELMAEALSGLPITRCFVVHGAPGWDEATPCGPFTLFDVRPGVVRHSLCDPSDHGIQRCSPAELAGGDAAANAQALEAVLDGSDRGAHRSALLLGTGLVLELTGRSKDLDSGIATAAEALDAGVGMQLLARLRDFGRTV